MVKLSLRCTALLSVFTLFFVSAYAQDDRVQVVASYSILADIVENIAGDAADVRTLMPVETDPHTFEPTPRDLTAVADADVVFTNGAQFEEGLLEAIESADTNMSIFEVSACVDIIPFGAGGHEGTHEHNEEHGESHEEHAEHEHEHEHEHDDNMNFTAALCAEHHAEMDTKRDDADHEEHHEHQSSESLGMLYALDCEGGHSHDAAEEHDHGACDPHVWMDTRNVMYWTMFIRDTLIELDPTNAETYTANAVKYLDELETLSHEFLAPMVESVPEENRVLVTNHESLGYFAHRYGFEIVSTVLPGGATGVDPSTANIAAVIDRINADGITAIFAETTVSDAVAQQIAQETGAQIHVLYSGSLSDNNGPASTYIDYMTYNVSTIVNALGGGIE